jgi:hydroxymethylbilane synthase
MSNQQNKRNFYDQPLKIGTRGSPLALAQAYETKERLMKLHDLGDDAFEICVINTMGDKIQDRALSEIGGKGLFTKEIEEGLLSGQIDIAVHSMKDMPTELPKNLEISVFLEREDPRDSFISDDYSTIEDLPSGSVVGTSSLRRKAQLLAFRSDLKVIEFRGNVQTRLRKLKEKVADATFLACAGLNRLLMQDLIKPVPIKQMLPAVAQGVIGIENTIGNKTIFDLIEPLNHKKTAIQMTVERSFLAVLDGSCRTPIGGHAIIKEEEIFFHGEILKPDGSIVHKDVWSGPISDSKMIGETAGQILKEKGGKNFFG